MVLFRIPGGAPHSFACSAIPRVAQAPVVRASAPRGPWMPDAVRHDGQAALLSWAITLNTGTLLLYITTVLIWGSTWLAIPYQLGSVATPVSIAHRSALAAFLIFLWLVPRRQHALPTRRDHGFALLQGMALFSGNYLFIYFSAGTLSSGLIALVFSMLVIFNSLNSALFLRVRPGYRVLAGAVLGVAGMALVFLPELRSADLADDALLAILLCLLGTYSASLGNIIAVRHARAGVAVLTGNAWGLGYGAALLYLLALLLGEPIVLPFERSYLLSLLYLSVVGSVIAFWAYVSLIGRIGPDRAAYTSLLFPLVALALSARFEGYRWSGEALAGVALILFGNWLALPARQR